MKKYLRDYAYLFGLAGTIIIFDQWTKYLVRTNLAFTEIWSPWPWLEPYVRIVHWKNTGAAFGMFQQGGTVFSILAVIVSIAIIYYFPQVPKSDWPLRLAMSMQLGGAVGNLIDRITVGSVTDFVSIGNFAVFNVADASISMGVATLIIGMWIKERNQPESYEEDEEDPGRSQGEAPSETRDSFGSDQARFTMREDVNGD